MAYWPTRTDFALPEQANTDIQLLIDKLPDLPSVIEAAKRHRPTLLVSEISDAVATEVNQPARDVRRIFNTLENLQDLEDELGNADAVIDRLTRAVSPDVADKIRHHEDQLRIAIDQYDRNNPVSITFKAQRLTYRRERLFHEAEIITDARPVFNANGEQIIEFVVTHTLVVTDWIDQEFRTQYISLDNADILQLRKVCDRAILKAKTLKQSLEEKWPTKVLRDAPD